MIHSVHNTVSEVIYLHTRYHHMNMTQSTLSQDQLVNELRWRGMIHDTTPGTEEQLAQEVTAGYIGFDPTAKFIAHWQLGNDYVAGALAASRAHSGSSGGRSHRHDRRSVGQIGRAQPAR